jgi:hypothetical protein
MGNSMQLASIYGHSTLNMGQSQSNYISNSDEDDEHMNDEHMNDEHITDKEKLKYWMSFSNSW